MNHQYSKYAGQTQSKDQEAITKRRQARESEPPMMPSYSPLDKTPTTPNDLLKPKQPQTFEQASRNNNKFVGSAGELEKPMYKTSTGLRSNEASSNNGPGKRE